MKKHTVSVSQRYLFGKQCFKVNSQRFGVTFFLSRDRLNGKASSTVILSEKVVETEMAIAIKHRRLLLCNFSVLCSNAFIFRNIVCLFLSKGSNSQLILKSLCLNGLRIKLYKALLLQSTHVLLPRNSWRDHRASLRTDNTKEASQFLHLLFLFSRTPVARKTILYRESLQRSVPRITECSRIKTQIK